MESASMILPDVNLLVHAHNSDSPVHDQARRWWDRCLAGTEGIGLAWVALLGFIRISTNRKILLRPMPVDALLEQIEAWLEMPHVQIAHPSSRHFERLRRSFKDLGTAGNLTTDAHLAALAMERGYVLFSTDTDFDRFRNLRWSDPIRG